MSKIVRHCLGRVPGILLGGAIALGTTVEVGAAGEILVLDGNHGAFTEDGRGSLFVVDPASGVRTLVSDFRDASQGALVRTPVALALEPGGTVLVADEGGQKGRKGALFRVDLGSGGRTVVTDFEDASQEPAGGFPAGVVVEASGTILVVSWW